MLYFNERENQMPCCLLVVDVSHPRQCISKDNNYQILMEFSVEEDYEIE